VSIALEMWVVPAGEWLSSRLIAAFGRQGRIQEVVGMVTKISLEEKFSRFTDQWSPKIVADLNDNHVKLARVQGEFVWHQHADEDELFLVIKGELTIELRDGRVTLGPGELAVIPKGVEHRPVAGEEVQLMLIEPKGIRHTGDVISDRTVHAYSRI
jgi:mannose-6-phosphate isomerase-like protein (cupin superfamily)